MANKEGAKLSVLENYVIDWREWDLYHPGGKFILSKTRGKDLTKYFNGGYAFNPNRPSSQHLHSLQANEIASGLIIAYLKEQVEIPEAMCKVAQVEKLNSSVSLFRLQNFNF